MSTAETMVELIDVTKQFGETVAVNDVSLQVKSGEFITLLGPSGCGKTTTLRLIAGFIKPNKGQVIIKGEDVSMKPPYERNLGMVFQNYALFPHMTAFENIAFGLKMRNIPLEERKAKVKEVLDLVRLSQFEERYPREMSGGQQQRIALARALVIEPDVLLLDEPLSNLDLKLRMQMRFEMKAIQSRVGVTTIYVTHDQGEALTMSDRVAVMQQGKLMQLGSPFEVFEHPHNQFVADFIGEANFFQGTIEDTNGEAKVAIAPDFYLYASLERVEHFEQKFTKNTRVRLAVRPQRIMLSKTQTQTKNSVLGKIENLEYVGSNVKYVVQLGGDLPTLIVDKQIDGLTPPLPINEEVYVEWDPANCLILPEVYD